MKTDINNLYCLTPQSFQQALIMKKENPHAKILAGGTDLMVQVEKGQFKSKDLINIWPLDELRKISWDGQTLEMGSLCTYEQILGNDIIKKEFPMLFKAAGLIGAKAIQSRATIGGNIVNASPAADAPPALLAYDAQLEVANKNGSRIVRYRDFHLDYKQMDLQGDEILKSIRLSREKKYKFHFYHKVGTRRFQSISKVCLAMAFNVKKNIVTDFEMGIGSVGATPLYCKLVKDVLEGQKLNEQSIENAIHALASEISPLSDIRSTKEYRLQVSLNLLEYYLRQTVA